MMAEAISDRQVVAVLRPFVRATGPMVDALREADPFGFGREDEDDGELDPTLRTKFVNGLRSVRVPGTDAWAAMGQRERTDWWVHRVGRFTALLTAVPSLGGALADRLPIQDTLGAASQGVLLCAVAGERGITDVATRVRLVAWVLFERGIAPDLAAGTYAEHDDAAEDAETDRLTEDLSASSEKHGKVTLKAGARTLWRLGRSLLAVSDELEKRPSGRFYHHALGALPIVGVVGGYLGERSGLKEVAERAEEWFSEHA